MKSARDGSSETADLAPIVGANLRQLRIRRGLSLEKLAQRSGVSRAMLGQIELGQSAPTINVLWKIARALDVTFATLIQTREAGGTTVLKCRPIGILRASQKSPDGTRVRNDRLVTVAEGDRRRALLKEARDLGGRERDEIEQFLFAAVALEGKELALLGWGDAAEARAAVDEASVKSRARSA